jgi:hypothetical protein
VDTNWQAATKKVTKALEKSGAAYRELLEKYMALKETVENGATNSPGKNKRDETHGFVLMMIDAYNNKVCSQILLNATH